MPRANLCITKAPWWILPSAKWPKRPLLKAKNVIEPPSSTQRCRRHHPGWPDSVREPEFVEIFGYDKPEDIVSKPVFLVVHPDDRINHHINQQRQRRACPFRYEFKGMTKDGRLSISKSQQQELSIGHTRISRLFKGRLKTERSWRSVAEREK